MIIVEVWRFGAMLRLCDVRPEVKDWEQKTQGHTHALGLQSDVKV